MSVRQYSERTACQMCRTVKEGVQTSSSSAAWRCSRCQFDNGSERTACQMCRYVKEGVQSHCCMTMCYEQCDDCEGEGCQSCDHSGHAYVCNDCEWVGPGSKCPGKICPGEDGEECGSEVHIQKYQIDLVYLGCEHIFCKSCFDGYVETKVRDDTISCPLFALPASDPLHCNYKVTNAEQRQYMKEKYDRRDDILNNKALAESGMVMCPQNAVTGCTWGYLPPVPRPCEDCGGTRSMTASIHHTRTGFPWYNSSYDEEKVTPCGRCVDTDTPGVEPNQAHSVICMSEICRFKFCSSCKKRWDNERTCPRDCDRNGKIEVSRGGFRGWFSRRFGGTKLIDCPECDGHRVVDVRTHEGKTCEEYAVALSTTDKDAADQQHEQDDEQTLRWKRENTRKCPRCNIVVFKQGDRAAGETGDGCNHMTCPCGKDFCWTCGRDAFPGLRSGRRGCWISNCVDPDVGGTIEWN